ncbi:MAG: dinitrogenase iron-molybdenum cofactor biosynthesis protein [Candidatus Marinimicrobia bacterium]|nr:dinitrogenase iron-molybdenum cofactor biosynthesis protein [Candidatus Neomarinimicrobiota bacterium]
MLKFTLAIATDDGQCLIKRHFGDSDFYYIYDVGEAGAKLLQKIPNTVDEEEEIHADPQKAKGIAQILKKEGVDVLASKAFGPNIKRMIKKFACVMLKTESLEAALELILIHKETIKKELDKGENRIPLKF